MNCDVFVTNLALKLYTTTVFGVLELVFLIF